MGPQDAVPGASGDQTNDVHGIDLRVDETRPGVTRMLLTRVLPTSTLGLVPCLVKALSLLPTPVVTRLLAIGMLIGGVPLLLRLVGHLHDDYFTWEPGCKLLSGLVIANGGLTALWIASGAWMLVEPDPVLQFALSIFLFVAVPTLAASTVHVADGLGKERGSEYVRGLEWVKMIRQIQDRMEPIRAMKWLAGLWNRDTAKKNISWLIALLATFALIVAGANAPETGAAFVKALAGMGEQHDVKQDDPRDPRSDEDPGSTDPGPAATPSVKMTYVGLCGGDFSPRAEAPGLAREQAKALYDLWLGPRGVGAVVGGCAQRPHAMPDRPDIWWSAGICQTELRSIAISAAGRPAGLLLQQAARYVWRRVRDGTLTGVSGRQRIGNGDFVLVDTVAGTSVLIRSRSSAGPTGWSSTSSCARFTDENVAYAEVPPALVSLWIKLARDRWVWPIQFRQPAGAPMVFAFATTAGEVIANAWCGAQGATCAIRAVGEPQHASTTSARVTAGDLLQLERDPTGSGSAPRP